MAGVRRRPSRHRLPPRRRRRLPAAVYLWTRISSGEAIYHPIAVEQRSAGLDPSDRAIEKMAHLTKSTAVTTRLDCLAPRLIADLGL